MGRGKASRSETPPVAHEKRSRQVRVVAGILTIAAAVGLAALAWRAFHPSRVKRDPGLSVLLVSDRHAARRRARLLRPRGRGDAVDRPPGRGGRALRDGPRPQRRHAALARQPALGPLPASSTACATTAGFRFPADRPTLATLLREQRLAHRRLRQRLPARLALRSRPRASTSTTTALGGAETRRRVPGAGAARARDTVGRGARAGSRRCAASAGFAFVHLYEPHFPYEPPEPFAAALPRRALPRRGGGGRRRARAAARAAPRGGARRRARSSSSPRTTASRSASTARRPTASSPTRRRCACRSSCTRRGSSRRASCATPVAPRGRPADRARRPGPRGAGGPARPQPAAAGRRRAARRRAGATSRRCARRSTAAGRRCTGSSRRA